jgi:ribonuclease HII
MSTAPTRRFERELLRQTGARWLACVDEVGRGALGGPVTVGVVLVDVDTRAAPTGVRDSKLLSASARERLVPKLRAWAPAWAVGHASAAEIDAIGLMRAMRCAGERAFAQLPHQPEHILLDGSYDWISKPEPALFDEDGMLTDHDAWSEMAPVTTRVKADMSCSGVAAASVLAKTTRDALMIKLAGSYPQYAWAENKGYSAPDHLEALRQFGPCEHHRRSWSIPTPSTDPDDQRVAHTAS